MAEAPAAMTMSRSERVSQSDDNDIVVTGARVRSSPANRRGDWNACTVDDPAQDADRCRTRLSRDARAAPVLTEGLSLAWRGETDGAIAAFGRAIAIAPRDPAAYLNRALAFRRKGEPARALDDLNQAVRLAPNGARYLYHRALVARQTGDRRLADRDEERAIELDSQYALVVDRD
jgi:tetratricopeptide (TPR) repeat protein